MQGPDSDFRAYVHERTSQAMEADDESLIEELLAEIEDRMHADLDNPAEDALQELGAVDSWAAVASHAVARFHAPASPWPRNVAGWGQKAAARLRSIANVLANVLNGIKSALGASGYSISVGFPWGISIGIDW